MYYGDIITDLLRMREYGRDGEDLFWWLSFAFLFAPWAVQLVCNVGRYLSKADPWEHDMVSEARELPSPHLISAHTQATIRARYSSELSYMGACFLSDISVDL